MTERDIEAAAARVASRAVEMLREQQPFPRSGLLRAGDVARLLSVETDWVYEHKAELGATRLDGALRFEATAVHAYIRRNQVAPEACVPARGRTGPRHLQVVRGVEMLPLPERRAGRG